MMLTYQGHSRTWKCVQRSKIQTKRQRNSVECVSPQTRTPPFISEMLSEPLMSLETPSSLEVEQDPTPYSPPNQRGASLIDISSTEPPSPTINCFAVLKNNGREVDLFDAHGKHKTFSMVSPSSPAAASMETKKICFSTHGVPVDGLLTPCLDEDGLHISSSTSSSLVDSKTNPFDKVSVFMHSSSSLSSSSSSTSPSTTEMDCAVCNVKAAHLHAHVHDPVKCSMDYSSRSSSNAATLLNQVHADNKDSSYENDYNGRESRKPPLSSDLQFLASLTFMEKSDSEHSVNNHSSHDGHHHHHGDDDSHNHHQHGHGHDQTHSQTEEDHHESTTNPIDHHHTHSHHHHHEDPFHDDFETQHITAHLPITDSLPKQCNSKEYSRRLSELEKSSTTPMSVLHERRVLSKVQHEDHIDILVHNNRTGKLQLEHPCDSCGENDFHGKFDLVGTRSVLKEGEDLSSTHKPKRVHLHFFELPTQPFQIVDLVSDLFSLNSPDRVAAIRDIHRTASTASSRMYPRNRGYCEYVSDDVSLMKPQELKRSLCCTNGTCHIPGFIPDEILNATAYSSSSGSSAKKDFAIPTDKNTPTKSTAMVRSQFYVKGICCSSETSQILAILQPIIGIQSVRVNAQLKSVMVEHDPSLVQATDIQKALDRERFKSRITEDGGMMIGDLHLVSQSREEEQDQESKKRSQFFVENICCAAEIRPIRSILETMDGIHEVSINVTTKMVYVRHDVSIVAASEIESRLNKQGFRTQILVDVARVQKPMVTEAEGKTESTWESVDDSVEIHTSKLNPLIVISGLFWIISMFSYIGGNWHHLKYVGIGSVICSSPPIAAKAFRTLCRRQFDVNCMMLLAIIGAVALQDFEEAAAVAFLFSISEWLETKATARARTALSAIVSLRPDFAYVIDENQGTVTRVPASAVSVGVKVSIRQGDKIPCDGVVVQGSSSVNESSITGESRPVRKTIGDIVSGGTINCGLSHIAVLVTATVDNSAVSKLIRLVEDAQMNRSPTEMLIDSFAKRYTPFVVLLSLCMITIPWAWGKAVGQTWMRNGLITIVLACPCALVISTPVTYVAALAAMAQKGILVKGGAFLEALGRVRKVCMDKTGTLTEGNFTLDFFEVVGSRLSRREVLEYLASVEGSASHPIASALVTAAENEGIDVKKASLNGREHSNIEGLGVSAIVHGLTVHAGNIELFKRLGLTDDLSSQETDEWKSKGGSLGFISVSGYGIVGCYSVSDKVRSEAKTVVSALLKSGITVSMLTGDNHAAAQMIGNQVGIDSQFIKSQLLPQEKLDFIRIMKEDEFQAVSTVPRMSLRTCCNRRLHRLRRGLVLMCGDGVNDSPALATADVGVSMGKGAALAIESSDITLMDSNLEKLVFSLEMGRRVRLVILQNIIFSVVTKLVVVVLVFVGLGSLWLAISSDVVAMLIVTANGMRLLPSSRMVTDMKFELSASVPPPV